MYNGSQRPVNVISDVSGYFIKLPYGATALRRRHRSVPSARSASSHQTTSVGALGVNSAEEMLEKGAATDDTFKQSHWRAAHLGAQL